MYYHLNLNENKNVTSKMVGCSIVRLVTLLVGNAWGSCMDPYNLWWVPQTFPRLELMLCLDPLLWFLSWLQEDALQQETIREFWRRSFITQPVEGICDAWRPHSEVKERKRGGQYRCGALHLLGSESGCLGFCRFTLYWKI